MSFSKIVGSLKIRTRLYTGFAVLMVVTLGLAVSDRDGISRVGSDIKTLSALSGNVRRVMATSKELEVIRRASVRYMADRDDASLDQLRKAEDSAKTLLEAAAGNTLSQERLALYQGLSASLAEERRQAQRLAELGQSLKAEIARLVSGGDELTAATDRLMAAGGDPKIESAMAAAERAILLVRVTNWRFQATHDAAGIAKFALMIGDARKALDSLRTAAGTRLDAEIAAVSSKLDTYQSDFDKASTTMLAQTQLYDQTLLPNLIDMQTKLATAEASLIAGIEKAEIAAHTAADDTARVQLVIAGGAMILGLVLAFFVGRSILRPLMAMVGVMRTLAGGDLTVAVPERGSKTELGEMAGALEVFKENGVARARLAEEQERDRAARERRTHTITELTRSFEAKAGDLVAAVSGAATELLTTAEVMGTAAQQTTHDATDMAAAAGQAGGNVQTVAAASEELAASIGEITQQVGRSAEVARRAMEDAKRTDGVVRALSDSALKIGEVVGLISTIAGQTNLLALNATIEAARAGDAGKGFAVVASEVKGLAAKTATATQEIEGQIGAIQAATRDAVESIQGIGRTIDEISAIATAIAAAMEEQGSATQEIARNVQQAAIGTQEVTSSIDGVTRRAGETSTSAVQVQTAAGELSVRADQIREEVTA